MTTQPPPPSQNFAGKVIAVTGASRGTGLTLSRYLLARGAKVSMCATSEARLAEALQGIEADMPEVRDRVMTAVVDISKADTVEAWINATVARFGQLNGAANVAGGSFLPVFRWTCDMMLLCPILPMIPAHPTD